MEIPTYINMSASERMKYVLKYLVIKERQLAKELGVDPGTIYNVLKGKNKITGSMAIRIHDRYKVFNPAWLETGSGKPTLTPEEISEFSFDPGCTKCAANKIIIESLQRSQNELNKVLDGQQTMINNLKSSLDAKQETIDNHQKTITNNEKTIDNLWKMIDSLKKLK